MTSILKSSGGNLGLRRRAVVGDEVIAVVAHALLDVVERHWRSLERHAAKTGC